MKFRRLSVQRLREFSGQLLRSLFCAVDGAAAIEMAFILPIAILLFIATVDYGVAIYRQMEVRQAAQVGAEYAVLHGFNANAISQAVTGATVFGVSASPAPATYCGCATSAGVTTATCGTTCSDGTSAGTYAKVSSQGQYSTVLPYPYVQRSFTLTGQATVRIQ